MQGALRSSEDRGADEHGCGSCTDAQLLFFTGSIARQCNAHHTARKSAAHQSIARAWQSIAMLCRDGLFRRPRGLRLQAGWLFVGAAGVSLVESVAGD